MERDHAEGIDFDAGVIKHILEKQDERAWNGLIWLWKGKSGRLL